METIKDIKPIERSPEFVCHRDFLNEIVELPCLEACFSLYDKNIQTHMSSANLKDKIAYIDIVYESLDDNNKKIAEQLINVGKAIYDSNAKILKIFIPISSDSKIEDVSNGLLEITNCFLEQDLLYGKFNSLMEFNEIFTHQKCNSIEEVLNSFEMNSVSEYLNAMGNDLGYDEDTGEVWYSKELLEKHKKFINKKLTK